MKKIFLLFLLVAGFILSATAQVVPEHGFLPGKKFKYYPTIGKYDFSQAKFRVEVYDDRSKLNLKKIACSDIEFTNTSEFAEADCIDLFAKYVDTLLTQSNAIVDPSSTDTIQVRLEGIDSRLIGFGKIRAHGLCQATIKYKDKVKSYCIDITDADKNSPISKNAFVTRKTGTRIIASAAMREVVELFLKDLATYK